MVDPKELISDFIKAAALAGIQMPMNCISHEVLPAPHNAPRNLQQGKMAVYVFSWKGPCLRVGKVGTRSQARYTSQHYNAGSSNSNVAKSILKDQVAMGISGLSEANIGEWIRKNTDRINFIMDEEVGVPVLSLLETFLQCRLKPKYEGFESQK